MSVDASGTGVYSYSLLAPLYVIKMGFYICLPSQCLSGQPFFIWNVFVGPSIYWSQVRFHWRACADCGAYCKCNQYDIFICCWIIYKRKFLFLVKLGCFGLLCNLKWFSQSLSAGKTISVQSFKRQVWNLSSFDHVWQYVFLDKNFHYFQVMPPTDW